MGTAPSTKVHSEAPLYDVVDDFLKVRVENVARKTVKRKAQEEKYSIKNEKGNEQLHEPIYLSPRHFFSKVPSPGVQNPPISIVSKSLDDKRINNIETSKLTNKFGLTIKITNNQPLVPESKTIKTSKDATRSVRALAKRHNSRQQNSYISTDVLSSFISTQQKHKQSTTINRTDSQSKSINGQHSVPTLSFKKTSSHSSISSVGGLTKQPSKRSKGNEDEEDWIQVSDDEFENSVETPRLRDTLSLHRVRQSYIFTNSGTIFVDGFTAGIAKNGIQTSMRDFKLPMKERLMMLCRLGQGASSVVYKALDVVEMRLVALKMVSVFDRSKRRQMVRELSALFQMLRKKQQELRDGLARNALTLKATTPLGIRISSRPCSRGSTPQPASFYMPDRGRVMDSRANSTHGPIVPQTSGEGEGVTGTGTGDGSSGSLQAWASIVDFYDAFSNLEDGGVALMMEYLDGGSLQEIVEQGGCGDEHTLASVAQQALGGLEFLHSCNQLHRDLKPANMLINQVGNVKISDFGIIRQLDAEESVELSQSLDRLREGEGEGEGEAMQRAYTFVGTMTYMAPERIDGREYSFPSDVWSLGLSLLALALGRLPLDTKGGFWSILHCIRDMAPPALPADGDWSPEFRDFISKCLRQDPSERATCSELLKHPFLNKAYIDPDTVPSEEHGLQELRSVIHALYEHVAKLEDVGDSILLEACRDKDRDVDVMDTLHRILFAENSGDGDGGDGGGNEKAVTVSVGEAVRGGVRAAAAGDGLSGFGNSGLPSGGRAEGRGGGLDCAFEPVLASTLQPGVEEDGNTVRATARLGLLASQLHIPVERVVVEAKKLFKELVRERRTSNISVLDTPKACHDPAASYSSSGGSCGGFNSAVMNALTYREGGNRDRASEKKANNIVRPISPLATMIERKCHD